MGFSYFRWLVEVEIYLTFAGELFPSLKNFKTSIKKNIFNILVWTLHIQLALCFYCSPMHPDLFGHSNECLV